MSKQGIVKVDGQGGKKRDGKGKKGATKSPNQVRKEKYANMAATQKQSREAEAAERKKAEEARRQRETPQTRVIFNTYSW